MTLQEATQNQNDRHAYFSVRLPAALHDAIDEAARREFTTRATIMRQALVSHLGRMRLLSYE